MSAEERITHVLSRFPAKPGVGARQSEKKRYSEIVSRDFALAIAEEFRQRGLSGTRPAPPGVLDRSGAERRLGGGIGAKKVDVSYATEESGLVLGVSVKSINFADAVTGNFQKNLTNRRNDMLFESVTLHRRFPYAVLCGVFLLDAGAAADGSPARQSTYINAHQRLKLFTGRRDPGDREEQYERLYVALLQAMPPSITFSEAGHPHDAVSIDAILDELTLLVAERNPDFYEVAAGRLRPART